MATETQEGLSESVLYPGYILGCITPLLILCQIYTINTRLSHVNPFVTVFWVSLIGSVVMTCVMGMLETPDFPSGAMCIGFMFVHLIGVLVNYLCFLVISMKLAPIITVLLFTLEITIGLIAQYTVLKNINPGHGNYVEILGAVAVIVGNVITPLYVHYANAAKGSTKQLQSDGMKKSSPLTEGSSKETDETSFD